MGLVVECPECKRRNSQKVKSCKKCGFALTKFSGRVWYIEYYDHNKELRRERVGPNKEAAAHRLREVLSARTEGRVIKRARELKITFNQLAERYHQWARMNNKSYEVNKAYFINQLTKFFGPRRLVDISPWLVERWKRERSEKTGFTEVDNELKTLKHMFTMGIDWKMTCENPARKVTLFRKARKRTRFLSLEEIGRLFAFLPEHQIPMIKFALLTGLRKANFLNLRWTQIDFNHGYLIIPAQESKSGHVLEIHLATEAIELLKGLSRHPESDYVFCKPDGQPYKDIYNGFRQAVKQAGIDDCTLHTLRHTFGSHLAMEVGNLVTVKELMGHRDIQTTMRYAHLAHDHKREAVRKLGNIFTNVFTKPQEKEEGAKVITLTP